MPALLSLDEASQVALFTFAGVVTDRDILDGFRAIRGWMATNGPVSSITDFSAVTEFSVTSQAVNFLAAQPPLVPDGYLRIVVAPRDEIFGMARMFEMLGSSTRASVQVVRLLGEAHALLGREHFEFHPLLEL